MCKCEEGIKRKSFTFYRSFYEALCYLPEEHRLPAFMAICAYALDGEEPRLEGVPGAIFTLIRPNLDASIKKAESGQAGGRASKLSAAPKQSGSKKELGEGNMESGGASAPPASPAGREQLVQWAEHVAMTNREHEKLLAAHGPADTSRLIEILDNYKGATGKHYASDYRAILSWAVDRLREEKGRTAKPDLRNNGTPGEFERQALERMMAMEQEEHKLEGT